MAVDIPEGFRAFAARSESWASWLAALPRLAREVLAEWELAVDGQSRWGHCALAVPVRTRDQTPAVVKFGWPHSDARHEHLALQAWGGRGAVRLLRADPRRWVLLLERADAEHDLHSRPVLEACEVVAGLYGQLHQAATPQFDLLSVQAARWAVTLPALLEHQLVPRRYVSQAAALAHDLATDPATDGTLVHTDLHYSNVLAADRACWLAIDPKPLSGDPAYEVAPMLWNRWDEAVASGSPRRATIERLELLVDAAGLDEDRVRAWVVVRELVNVLWALGQEVPSGAGLDDQVTVAVTIVKAVQR